MTAALRMTERADPLSLVTWNIRDLTGAPGAVTVVLGELAADIYCLQEVPRRLGGQWRLGRAIAGTGLRVVAGGPGSGGTAILASARIQAHWSAAVPLPVPHWHVRRRGVAVADLSHGGQRLVVGSIHLPLLAEERERHAAMVRQVFHDVSCRSAPPERVATWRGVVAGDFNETPEGPAWAAFHGFSDPAPQAPPTFPTAQPGARLDGVLTYGDLAVLEYETPDLDPELLRRASDHRPIRVRLTTSGAL